MPRNGHRNKGTRRYRKLQTQLNDDFFEELRAAIYKQQAERRQEDEEQYFDELEELDELKDDDERGRDEW